MTAVAPVDNWPSRPQAVVAVTARADGQPRTAEAGEAVGAPVLTIRTAAGDQRCTLTAPSYRVGRHPDSDIVISSPIVSRFHLVLERQNGGYRLRDTSLNGTWQGGRQVSVVELPQPTELQIGQDARERVTLVYRPYAAVPASTQLFPPISLEGRSRLLIGHDSTCDLRLADPSCEPQHAVLERGPDGRWAIQDLGSRNGTFVNGSAVARGTRAPLGASSRTALQFGNTRAVFDGGRLLWAGNGPGMRVDARGLVTRGDQSNETRWNADYSGVRLS